MLPRLVFLALLVAGPLRAASLPDGFVLQQVGWGPFAGQPVGFTRLPDERLVIIERETGQVRINPVGATASTFLHTIPDVNANTPGERGLLGITHDPDWPTRPYLYFYFSHVDSTCDVVMLTASGDLDDPTSTNLTLSDQYVILDDIPDDFDLHQAGTLRFGPDGMLYVSTGDDGVGCRAQRLYRLAGKILRLDVSSMPGPGSGPPPKADITPADNPFPGPDENERLVWAWGLRNPFRFTIDGPTGDVFLGDVGTSMFEEVNWIPFAGGGGENFGWPILEGTSDTGLGLECGVEPYTDPAWFYARVSASAVIGGPLYREVPGSPRTFPASYDGTLFVADFYKGWLKRLEYVGGVWQIAPAVPGQPTPDSWGLGFAYTTDFQRGADGALYVNFMLPTDEAPGVWRIAPPPPSSAPPSPVAATSLRAFPNPARAGAGVTFAWSSPGGSPTRLTIHDAAGRLVRALGVEAGAADGSLSWDGGTLRRGTAGAGVYFVRLVGPSGELGTAKLVLLR